LRDKQNQARFIQACQINASLQHPGIPPLLLVAENQGRTYAARQYIDGDMLLFPCNQHLLPPSEVVPITAQIADALDHVHQRGLVHRFVLPKHILLDRDRNAYLIGFGEWPPLYDRASGNPHTLAPEQFTSAAAMPATDVYALAEL